MIHRTLVKIYVACFNVDVTTAPTRLEVASLTFTSKVQAIHNLHYCVRHIAPERLQHHGRMPNWLPSPGSYLHVLPNKFGTSGHVKWHPESLYATNLTKYDVTARIQEVGRLEDYQFLLGATHFDGEDGLLYVTKEVYVGQSPKGSFTIVSWALL